MFDQPVLIAGEYIELDGNRAKFPSHETLLMGKVPLWRD